MRHIYIRSILGLVWLAASIVSAIQGTFPMAGLYAILCAVFLYSAYSMWKKETKGDK